MYVIFLIVCSVFGDKIVLSSAAQQLVKVDAKDWCRIIELPPENSHLNAAIQIDDRLHQISIHHELAMVEADLRIQPLHSQLHIPPPLAPQVSGTYRKHWYSQRAPLRLTRTFPSETEAKSGSQDHLHSQWDELESMLQASAPSIRERLMKNL